MLLVAGAWPVLHVRRRTTRRLRSASEFTARAAIEAARVSRDSDPRTVPEAEELLSRAELLLASSAGADAADRATELARDADRLWSGR